MRACTCVRGRGGGTEVNFGHGLARPWFPSWSGAVETRALSLFPDRFHLARIQMCPSPFHFCFSIAAFFVRCWTVSGELKALRFHTEISKHAVLNGDTQKQACLALYCLRTNESAIFFCFVPVKNKKGMIRSPSTAFDLVIRRFFQTTLSSHRIVAKSLYMSYFLIESGTSSIFRPYPRYEK